MGKDSNKIRLLGIFLPLFLLALVAILAITLKQNKIKLFFTDLGVPYAEIYSEEQISSRLAEDITVHNGKLYVGGGDYDANTGPVYVMSYDLQKGQWERSAEPLPDEQIKRFRLIDGKLAVLGTDPRDGWELGNYYILDDGWETMRVLPAGIHCFDSIKWQGDLFFGLGVNSGDLPAVRFDGENYTAVKLLKNGEPLDTSAHSTVRIYNLFTYKGELFAFLTLDKTTESEKNTVHFMDLYIYDGESFVFSHGSLPAEDMPDVVTTADTAYFIMNDALLASENLVEFSQISLGDGVKASDVIAHDGRIYALGWRQISKNCFEATVFESTDDGFTKKFGLFAHAPAGSFCKDGDSFYISLGIRDLPTPHAGRVIRVTTK